MRTVHKLFDMKMSLYRQYFRTRETTPEGSDIIRQKAAATAFAGHKRTWILSDFDRLLRS